jgi:hypothetical protein
MTAHLDGKGVFEALVFPFLIYLYGNEEAKFRCAMILLMFRGFFPDVSAVRKFR